MATFELNADDVAALEAFEQQEDRGKIYKYPAKPDDPWPDGMPNPLVTVSLGLSKGIVNGEECIFYNG